jgi:hypothetical protein
VGGGGSNIAGDNEATVSGGVSNLAAGFSSTVGGGANNRARGNYSVIAGGGGAPGDSNSASGFVSAIGGGRINTASGNSSTIGGGNSNTASGPSAVVGGGNTNRASGFYATVPGGLGNRAAGWESFAAGFAAKALYDGSFVWGSSTTGDSTTSFNANTFTARCQGGARFYTHPSATNIGVNLPAGGGAWAAICDRNQKNLHGAVNTSDVLQRVTSLPLHKWSYKSQDESIRHIGPTAQDFHRAFGLGDNNTTISTLDPDGVLFAAVQELAKRTERIEELERDLAELRALVKSQSQYGFDDK